MQRRFISILAAVGLLAALPACDRPAGPAGPETLVAPRAAAVQLNTSYSTADGYTLLAGAATAEASRSATLSTSGGKISIGASQIVIPYGALPEPATVTLTMVSQPYVAARLTAVRVSDGTLITKFNVPLPLKISYAKTLTRVPDPTQLKIYYIVDGTVKSTMPTTVDVKGQALYTELNHFSEYSPGLDP